MSTQLADYKVGDKAETHAIIKTAEIKEARNGSSYLSLTIADKTRELNGKIWDVGLDKLEEYPLGGVVYVRGSITEYLGKAQIDFKEVSLLTGNEPENDKSLYIKTAPKDKDEMVDLLRDKIDKIEDAEIKVVVRDILNKYNKEIFSHAAANKMHHAFHGGLAYHTVSMLHLAESILSYYKGLNPSLLYGAIIIHDVCKVDEMSDIQSGSDYTKKGKLLGHIVMGENEIIRAAQDNGIDPDSENILLLRHMILSHHGKLEWGSPVKPQIREAWALHQIDMLDARMNQAEEAIVGIEPGEFSPSIYALDKTPLYHPNINA